MPTSTYHKTPQQVDATTILLRFVCHAMEYLPSRATKSSFYYREHEVLAFKSSGSELYLHKENFKLLLKLLLFLIVSSAAYNLHASVIYDNGVPNRVDGTNITAYVSADNFSIATMSTLTGVNFWSSADTDPYQSQFSGTVGWGVLLDNGGVPGVLLYSGADSSPSLFDTSAQIGGTEEWELQIELPSIVLDAGTYWLALHEGPLGTPDDGTEIYWDTTSNLTGSAAMLTSDVSGASGWFPSAFGSGAGSDLAFQLTGSLDSAPEPSLLLLLSALLLLVSARTLNAKNK
jgi:hypothetical protein